MLLTDMLSLIDDIDGKPMKTVDIIYKINLYAIYAFQNSNNN